jgi:voltage-gated potassium channel
VAAVDSDADNTFVILSARVLRPDLLIVGRANSEESLRKVKKAGADHVISPYSIGGKKMATLMLKPLVSDYLDVAGGGGEIEFRLEEFALNHTCEIVGKSIAELDIRRRTGATILAVRHGDSGLFDTNPSPELTLDDGDVVIAIGTPVDIANLEELFACHIPPMGTGGH